MSTYRTPVLLFGVEFDSLDKALAFSRGEVLDDGLSGEVLGAEFFDPYYVLGFQMKAGETTDKYQLMWNSFCFSTECVPKAMLHIRTC